MPSTGKKFRLQGCNSENPFRKIKNTQDLTSSQIKHRATEKNRKQKIAVPKFKSKTVTCLVKAGKNFKLTQVWI